MKNLFLGMTPFIIAGASYLFPFASIGLADEMPTKTFATSLGRVFVQIQRPGVDRAWRAPDGLIWGIVRGAFSNEGPEKDGFVLDSPASRACAEQGGILAESGHIRALVKQNFEFDDLDEFSDRGRSDFAALFASSAPINNPNLSDGSDHLDFWTRSLPVAAEIRNQNVGCQFGGLDGRSTCFLTREKLLSALCMFQ